jgi:uncharacterized membrane protein
VEAFYALAGLVLGLTLTGIPWLFEQWESHKWRRRAEALQRRVDALTPPKEQLSLWD